MQRSSLALLFREDFGVEAAPAPPAEREPDPPPPAPPRLTASDLDAAAARGRAEGKAEANTSLDAMRVQLLRRIAEELQAARSAARTCALAIAEQASGAVLEALAALLPALCEKHAETETRCFLQSILPAFASEPSLTIEVHPALLDAATKEAQRLLTPEDHAAPNILANESLAIGDARIRWSDGGAIRDTREAVRHLTAGLSALGVADPLDLEHGESRHG